MNAPPPPFKRDFVRFVVLPALSLLLVPVCGVAFSRHAQASQDRRFLEGLHAQIDADAELSAERRPAIKAFYDAHPPSAICRSDNPAHAQYRGAVCAPPSAMW